MDALDNLLELYNMNMTDKAEKVIAGWLLQHLEELKGATIYDIAEATGASRASVWRMVRSMGYSSFPEFLRELQSVVSRYSYHKRLLSSQNENSPELLRHVLADRLSCEAEMFRENLDLAYAKRIVDAVNEAQRVRFYVMTTCLPNRIFQENLAMMGKQTRVLSLMPEIMQDMETLGGDSFVFTNLLENIATLQMQPFFAGLRERGCKVVFFGTLDNRYADYVDFNMQDLFGGHPDHRQVYPENCLRFLAELYRIEYVDKRR